MFGIMIVVCIFESHEHKDVKPTASAPRSNRSWSSSLPGASPESESLTMIHGRPPSGRGPPSTMLQVGQKFSKYENELAIACTQKSS